MVIKLTNVGFLVQKRHLFMIMKGFMLLLCTTVFSFTSENSFSQKKILIDQDKLVTVDQVFKIIKLQTDYRFIYPKKIFVNSPKVQLKKGEIEISKLLKQSLNDNNFDFELTKNNLIIIKKKVVLNNEKEKLLQVEISGSVTDSGGQPLPGASVLVKGTIRGTDTDFDGNYSIEANLGDILVFSYIGMKTKEVVVGIKSTINVQLEEDSAQLDEVVLTAFGSQKKESVISSITSVNVKDLRLPSSNLTTALAGRLSGLVSYQTTGAPGADNADFFIRSVTSFGSGLTAPLILIDNVEVTSNALARLSPDDISSFSILKDAAATALYGARGANGVVLVATKEGVQGPVKVFVRYDTSLSTPTSNVETVNPVEWMEYANKASASRIPGSYKYTQHQVDMTKDPNRNRNVYPTVDWRDYLTEDYAINHKVNLNLSGGGQKATYYLSGSFSQDNGILKVDKANEFNTNINLNRFSIRSNVNLNLMKSLVAKLKVNANFESYTGPIGESGSGGAATYNKTLIANPVLFPAAYDPTENTQYKEHILFGNFSGTGNYLNPYADILRGYDELKGNNFTAQLELHQDLDVITKGLKARFIGSTTAVSNFKITRDYTPFYYQSLDGSYDPTNTKWPFEIEALNISGSGAGTEYIGFTSSDKSVSSRYYAETAILYNRKFNKLHDVGGLVVGTAKQIQTGTANDLESSLAHRNLGLAGRLTYGYDSKYFAEFNFGYNGSERFDEKHRYGFFPSVGLGWNITKENFWSNLNLDPVISKFKIRGSYGSAGNDAILAESENRFFFISNVNLNGASGGNFGNNYSSLYNTPTIAVSRYANPNITWEVSYKTNLALDLGFFNNSLDLVVEFYKERRTNILQARADIPATMGLTAALRTNVGESEGRGIDIALNHNGSVGAFWYILRGNFTYGTTEITKLDELDYSSTTPWLSQIGQKVGQNRGYVAERLFIDDTEAINSPRQFGRTPGEQYGAGDIKYRDINGDDIISNLDRVPMGYSSNPEIQYGFGSSFGFKNVDFSLFFQGSARYSFMMNPTNYAPFVDVGSAGNGNLGNRAMLQLIADDHWSESNRDPYAAFPRLSTEAEFGNNNNFVASNYWLRTVSYLRLKSVEFGYTIPEKITKNIKFRIYGSGTNLLTISDFKDWDPEMRGNGLRYPIQRVFNFGVQANF